MGNQDNMTSLHSEHLYVCMCAHAPVCVSAHGHLSVCVCARVHVHVMARGQS